MCKAYFPLLFFISFHAACTQKPAEIASEFQPFIDTIIEEGKARGVVLGEELSEISIQFGELEGVKTGKTSFYRFKPTTITISDVAWLGMSDQSKLFLLAHEIGHALLDRKQHRNDKTESGECLSIMREGGCSCNIYSDLWSEYYFDELFKESTILPKWYYTDHEDSTELEPFYQNTTEAVSSVLLDTVAIDTKRDFKIEVELNGAGLSKWYGFAWDYFSIEQKEGNLSFSHPRIYSPVEGYFYYTRNSIASSLQIKLVKKKGMFSIYLNEKRVHIFEYSAISKYRTCEYEYNPCDLLQLSAAKYNIVNTVRVDYLK